MAEDERALVAGGRVSIGRLKSLKLRITPGLTAGFGRDAWS
nr:hypothetical protein [Streptomyces sp. SID5770]